MPPSGTSLQPHAINKSLSVRRAYIQKLTELLHVCLLRGELERAKRAWSILVRQEATPLSHQFDTAPDF